MTYMVCHVLNPLTCFQQVDGKRMAQAGNGASGIIQNTTPQIMVRKGRDRTMQRSAILTFQALRFENLRKRAKPGAGH